MHQSKVVESSQISEPFISPILTLEYCGMGFIVWGSLYGVHCMGFIVWGSLYGVHCMGFIVWGSLYGVHCRGFICVLFVRSVA